MRALATVFFCFATACGLEHPMTGAQLGPGVGLATFETRTNGSDLVSVDVIFPIDASGHATGSARPAVVFVQGGFVTPDQYRWQAERLATAGYVVAMPHHLLDLAFFEVDNGAAARALVVSPPTSLLTGLVDPARIAVAGHSLGGVVASKLAVEGKFQALVLEASFPDSADDRALPSLKLPSLSLAGTKDCSAKFELVQAGWNKLPSPTALVVLSGLTHYQFTGDQAPDEKRNCLPEGSLDEAHARVGAALVSFLGSALNSQSIDQPALASIVGAEVQVR
jgi:dienelactone hydrolase